MNIVNTVPNCSEPTTSECVIVTNKTVKTVMTPQKLALRKKIVLLQSQRWKMRRQLEFLSKSNKAAKTVRTPKSDMIEIQNVTTSVEPFLTKLQLLLF